MLRAWVPARHVLGFVPATVFSYVFLMTWRDETGTLRTAASVTDYKNFLHRSKIVAMHIKFDISVRIFLPDIAGPPRKSDGKIAKRAQTRQKSGEKLHSSHGSHAKLP